MDIQTQKEFLKVYNKYQNTDRDIIAANLKNKIKESNLFSYQIMNRSGINMYTFNQMKAIGVLYKPDLIKLILITNELNISVMELFEPVEIKQKQKTHGLTKWNKKSKQKFIEDYENLDIERVIRIYNITKRTAGEYYRRFKEEEKFLGKV